MALNPCGYCQKIAEFEQSKEPLENELDIAQTQLDEIETFLDDCPEDCHIPNCILEAIHDLNEIIETEVTDLLDQISSIDKEMEEEFDNDDKCTCK